jgi:hypothetical protein
VGSDAIVLTLGVALASLLVEGATFLLLRDWKARDLATKEYHSHGSE